MGDLARAKVIAETYLDKPSLEENSGKTFVPNLFHHISPRGIATYTGTYKGVPVTIIGTGMGYSMIDFSIRESSAVIDGSIIMIRIGTCGSINPSLKVGEVIVQEEAVLISRNPDAFRKVKTESDVKKEIKIVDRYPSSDLSYYRASLPCKADEKLTELV